MNELNISVLIPAFNCADVLPDCLSSVLEQSGKPIEIIVIDDGSTDNTASVAESFEGINVIKRSEQGGAGAARATGVQSARSKIVAFLDSDCIAPVDWLEKIVVEFGKNPELGAVGGMYRHCHAKSLTSIFGKFEEEFLHHNFDKTPHESTLTGGNMAVRRSIWNAARSGRELVHFAQVASSEDTVVTNEIRQVSPTFFTSDIYVYHMPKDSFLGFFKRNIRRAHTRMISNLFKLSKNGDNLFSAFGGFRLFWAAAALWLNLPIFLGLIFYPELIWPGTAAIVGALILHFKLSVPFLSFISSQGDRPCPVELTQTKIIGLRLLIAARAACWVLGTIAGVSQFIVNRIHFFSKVLLSILHFWWPGRISKMFYFVTSKCNARCEFCFNLENVVNWKQRQPQELKLNEIQQIAKNLKRLPYLTFSGGEPFARPDLPDVVKAFYDGSKTMWVTIPTNGALTKNIISNVFDILTSCPDLFLTIQFSIDSLHEAHDESRKIKGGFDAMLKTAKRLSTLREHYQNLRVQINTPYDTFNLSDIDNIRDFCKSNIDFDQQLFYMFREDGTLISEKNTHLADGFLDFIQKHDANEWKERGQNLWGCAIRALQGVTYEDTQRIKKDRKYIRPCYATQKFITLYDDGSVAPCEVLSTTVLGKLREYDFDYYRLKKEVAINQYHKKQIIDTKCNCEWMCAPTINMLYHPPTWYRIVKGLLNPSQSNKNQSVISTPSVFKESK